MYRLCRLPLAVQHPPGEHDFHRVAWLYSVQLLIEHGWRVLHGALVIQAGEHSTNRNNGRHAGEIQNHVRWCVETCECL